jgi:hypothetical protein
MHAFIQGNGFRNTAMAVRRTGPLEETDMANTGLYRKYNDLQTVTVSNKTGKTSNVSMEGRGCEHVIFHHQPPPSARRKVFEIPPRV